MSRELAQPPPEERTPLKVVVIPAELLKLKRQIVQSEESESDDISEGAYLSDKNRSFDRQTRARNTDIFKSAQLGGGPKARARKKLSLGDLGASSEELDPFRKIAKNQHNRHHQGNHDVEAEEHASSTNDHVENVPLGDLTHLNTVEYKYYGFYHRIRQQLEQYWGKSIREIAGRLHKQGRHIADEENLTTALRITLDEFGEILAIKVLGSSGVQELDQAAIESFRDAGPFPNPPRGMLVDGKVTLEWGFIVET